MANLYVHHSRGVEEPPFSLSRPYKTISAAIAAAQAGDRIEVLDTYNYQEGQILINKSLTLVSTAGLSATVLKPTHPRFRRNQYPSIQPVRGRRERVILIQGNNNGGPMNVTIQGFVIHAGRSRNTIENDPAYGAGGGISVVNVGTGREEISTPSGIVIQDCFFTNNRTYVSPVGTTDLRPVRTRLQTTLYSVMGIMQTVIQIITSFLSSLGSAVDAMLEVAAVVNGLIRTIEQALSINIAPRTRQRIIEAMRSRRQAIQDFSGRLSRTRSYLPEFCRSIPDSMPNYNVAGQSFGAGICFVWSSGRVSGCKFYRNTVTGRGGGVGVVGYGWPLIDNCSFIRNVSTAQTRRDGGGLGIEVGIPEGLSRNLTINDLISDFEGWLQRLNRIKKATLAITFLGEALHYTFQVATGQQPTPNAEQEELTGLLIHLLIKSYLGERKYQNWNRTHLEAAMTAKVLVRNSLFHENRAHDDGGGVYASVLSGLKMQGCFLTANRALNGGGGAIRCSLASNLILEECRLQNNLSVGDRGRVGGGALAVRNGRLAILGNTRFLENRCRTWAGGAMQLSSEEEGGTQVMNGIFSSFYTAILVTVFGFQEMDVQIDGQAEIQGNIAGVGQGSRYGKGGGLYILRGSKVDVRPLRVNISNYPNVVTNNTGHASTTANSFHQIYLVDLAQGGLRVNDNNVQTYLNGVNFLYESGI